MQEGGFDALLQTSVRIMKFGDNVGVSWTRAGLAGTHFRSSNGKTGADELLRCMKIWGLFVSVLC